MPSENTSGKKSKGELKREAQLAVYVGIFRRAYEMARAYRLPQIIAYRKGYAEVAKQFQCDSKERPQERSIFETCFNIFRDTVHLIAFEEERNL